MSGDCGHGWLYHHDGPSGPCYACERDEARKLRAELAALRAEHDLLRKERDQMIESALIERKRAEKAEAERDALRSGLMELRIRLHAAGRRPEECYEMSVIDDALRAALGER